MIRQRDLPDSAAYCGVNALLGSHDQVSHIASRNQTNKHFNLLEASVFYFMHHVAYLIMHLSLDLLII